MGLRARTEGSGSRERAFAGSAGKRRLCLRPPEQRSRGGGCLFPPGPSAEALCPPPPATRDQIRGAGRKGFCSFMFASDSVTSQGPHLPTITFFVSVTFAS